MQDSLITRCPSCETAFRASEPQIAARNGQVRCGRCATVFDANAHRVFVESPTVPEAPSESFDLPSTTSADAQPPAEPIGAKNESLVLAPAPAEDSQPSSSATEPAISADRAVADPNLELDFGRKRRHGAATISPWIGWPGLVMLAILLLAQIAYHLRGDIALLLPETKPLLTELCLVLGCDLPLPRKPEMMSIESSDLQADTANPGVMVLSATLRNRAPFAQHAPALELTLTDLQDQPVARRVLNVVDYAPRGAAAGSMADRLFPASTEMPVKIYFEASSVRATGYRLYLFYP